MLIHKHIKNTHLEELESTVDSSLAITPSQMANLTSAGRAVSMASLENQSFFTNEVDVRDMPLEYTRGIDMNEVWAASRTSEKRVKDGIKAFRKRSVNTRSDGEQVKGGD